MTSDEKFLKSAHIEPSMTPYEQRWMEWRSEENEQLRALVIEQGRYMFAQEREKKQWKMVAIIAGLFALWLLLMPAIERIGR
jgi:hypothetical protein